MKKNVGQSIIELVLGDITFLDVDAIVNPANSQLLLGGGVAGAIRSRGGPSIQQECNRIGFTKTGTAAITGGGSLKARHVIHAVGPIMGEGNEDEKLRDATLSALKLATEKGLKSLAFPAISTGIFGYPKDRCAAVMTKTVLNFLESPASVERVIFCLFDQETLELFKRALDVSV